MFYKKPDIIAVYQAMVENGKIQYDHIQFNILKLLEELSNDFYGYRFLPRNNNKLGLYLYGDVGRGKSTIMNMYYEHCGVVQKHKLHFNTFMQNIHESLHKLRNTSTKLPLKTIAKDITKKNKLLFLDEMQVHDIGDAMILYRLFAALFANKIIFIITSNYAPDDLYHDGLQRELFTPAINLIKRNMHVIHLDGKQDYRTLKGTVHRYFTGKNANKALMNIFTDLTYDKKKNTTSLWINGREIKPKQIYDGISWFEFVELCSKPLWTTEYKKIAQSFHTVFISNIPDFNFSNQNEAKRFTVLIDELYEYGVKLFCSSTANYLFEHSQDLKRTISRLTEMCSRVD